MLLLLALAHATPGEVTLPLSEWTALHPAATSPAAPADAVHHTRRLVGAVDRGLLHATLTHQLDALRPVALPVLPAAATVVEARLDGQPAPLSLTDRYRVDVRPGRHTVQLDLLQGQASDRSERRVHLALPPGGPTSFELTLPEAPVDVTLAHGVVTSTREAVGHTVVTGWVDGSGSLDLAWERRTTHEATDARLDAEVYALLDLGGDLVTGHGSYRFDVLAGEVDRVALPLPPGLEVTEVRGDQVLQWHSNNGELAVLLREVEDEQVDLVVGYQYPAHLDGPTDLLTPLPTAASGVTGSVRGALGVVAPVAMDVALAGVDHARQLAPRDIPQALVELSADPLRAAIAFDEPPVASATTTRQGEVLTSASRIDDLQGISLLMEDGTEVGKLRLAVRNADRQLLTVDLPEGARLTHCFRDGAPLRPAADASHPGRVLVPLTRSRKTEAHTYTVEPGDTLSSIASSNYGDANRWQQVQWANPGVDADRLQVGQQLTLPALSDADTESFILELGWERHTAPLGTFGRRAVGLPELDLDVQAATWHVYLPEHLETLTVASNLTQLSGVHTDPLTRVVDFLVQAGVTGSSAYAGGRDKSGYKNAITFRRSTYEAEAAQVAASAEAVSAYPLVGQRIRFRGSLLGTEAPVATVRYVGEGLASTARTVLWLLAVGLGWRVGREPRDAATWAAVGTGVLGAGVVGHFLLGSYGRFAWGADVGMAVALIPLLWAQRRRPRLGELLGVGSASLGLLVLGLAKPILLPLVLAPILLGCARRLA